MFLSKQVVNSTSAMISSSVALHLAYVCRSYGSVIEKWMKLLQDAVHLGASPVLFCIA